MIAGVPNLIPLGLRGGFGSSGIICLFTVIHTFSNVSSATVPSISKDSTVFTTII